MIVDCSYAASGPAHIQISMCYIRTCRIQRRHSCSQVLPTSSTATFPTCVLALLARDVFFSIMVGIWKEGGSVSVGASAGLGA